MTTVALEILLVIGRLDVDRSVELSPSRYISTSSKLTWVGEIDQVN